MTIKEAIEILTHHFWFLENAWKPHPDYKVLNAIRIALSALNKQVPMKPELTGDGYADGSIVYDTWTCPRCGTDYEVEYDDYKYCPECGQKIDWEDNE